jgi:hypothetical protein
MSCCSRPGAASFRLNCQMWVRFLQIKSRDWTAFPADGARNQRHGEPALPMRRQFLRGARVQLLAGRNHFHDARIRPLGWCFPGAEPLPPEPWSPGPIDCLTGRQGGPALVVLRGRDDACHARAGQFREADPKAPTDSEAAQAGFPPWSYSRNQHGRQGCLIRCEGLLQRGEHAASFLMCSALARAPESANLSSRPTGNGLQYHWLLFVTDAILFPRAVLRIWPTSSLQSRT